MPTRPPSSASSRVIAITAPFTAACAKFPGVAGSELMPEIDPVLMIAPPPRRDEVRPRRAAGVEDEVQLVAHREVPVVVGRLRERLEARGGRVVVEDVDAAVDGRGLVDPGARRRGVAEVDGLHGRHRAAGGLHHRDRLAALGLLDVAADDQRALTGERERRGAALSTGRAGDERDLPLQAAARGCAMPSADPSVVSRKVGAAGGCRIASAGVRRRQSYRAYGRRGRGPADARTAPPDASELLTKSTRDPACVGAGRAPLRRALGVQAATTGVCDGCSTMPSGPSVAAHACRRRPGAPSRIARVSSFSSVRRTWRCSGRAPNASSKPSRASRATSSSSTSSSIPRSARRRSATRSHDLAGDPLDLLRRRATRT